MQAQSAAQDADRAIDPDVVLLKEANAIHKGQKLPDGTSFEEIAAGTRGDALYGKLYARHANALCLSGGGIRSASFALGVIEALAVHPRPSREEQSKAPEDSLLSKFHYLSTVSGGGYIGSWLSAWIARAGYFNVWPRLIGKRDRPEEEPSQIVWLRSYSNFLTPRLGLFSGDTWAAVALYVRNLILNWLVILPALCMVLLAVKTFAIGGFWLSSLRELTNPPTEPLGLGNLWTWPFRDPVPFIYGVGGVALMVWALRFAMLNRPSRDPCTVVPGDRSRTSELGGRAKDSHREEGANIRVGANEQTYWKHCLLPALAAALLLSLYFAIRGPKLVDWSLSRTALVSTIAGMGIYALAWALAWPPRAWVPCVIDGKKEVRTGFYWTRDFIAWFVAGGVYGAMIGIAIRIVAKYQPFLMIANVDVDHTTSVFLLAFIYGVPWIVTAQLTAEMIFVGLTSWQSYSDSDREWFGRSTGWFAISAFFWSVGTFVTLIAGDALLTLIKGSDWAKYSSLVLTAGSGLLSTLFGKSSKTAAKDAGAQSSWLQTFALPLGAIIFLLGLVLGVSVAMDQLMFDRALMHSSLMKINSTLEIVNRDLAAKGEELIYRWQDALWLAIGWVVIGIVAFIAWRRININRFSIHSLYRNRLIRGFLGASNPERAPNPFTGFDEGDNIPMKDIGPKDKSWRPFHVINTALNVVNSKRLAWQERKAESFTITPMYCGSSGKGLGYRHTEVYGDKDGGGISLGTALAISGAAASPNMGYNSSPFVTLLLALFNVRLGWWLGNPGPAGWRTYGHEGPQNAIRPFIAEMFGLTTDEGEYVYLSDGGHFENLGLYEMVRRRCRCIVVSDGGCDPGYGFEDLGNAVRKIAIDLGVYISFGSLRALKARSKDNSVIEGAYYAIGRIDYATAPGGSQTDEDGYILYIKPGYHGTESAGVVAYATANATFPHESTADQFFSESQFESYRTLGFEIANSVLTKALEKCDRGWKDRKAGDEPPPVTLCGLIKALDAEEPEKHSRVSDALKLLDKDDLAEMRTILAPPRP